MPLVRIKSDAPLDANVRLSADEEGEWRYIVVGDTEYTEVSQEDLQQIASAGYSVEIKPDEASAEETVDVSQSSSSPSPPQPPAPTFPPGQPSPPPPSASSSSDE